MNNDKTYIPYIVYDEEMARQERHIKRLLIILGIMLFLFFASNMAWLYVWNQYDYIDETETTIKATQDGEGVNIVGGEDVKYGPNSDDPQKEKDEEAKEKR